MASVNKVIIVGNLGRDPEIREFQNGLIANLAIATSRRYNSKDGTPVTETEWHRVTFFGRTAEICRDYLKKGSQAYVEGRLRTRKYQAQDGTDRYTTEIVGETLQLLDRRGDARPEGDAPAASGNGFTSAPRPSAAAAPAPAAQSTAATNDALSIEEDVPF